MMSNEINQQLLDALKAYMKAGFGNSTDFYQQHHAHKLASAAIAAAEGGMMAQAITKKEWVQFDPLTQTHQTPDGTAVGTELVDSAECLADVFHIAGIRDQQRKAKGEA